MPKNPKPDYTVRKLGDNYGLYFRGEPVESGVFATRKTADKHKRLAEYERALSHKYKVNWDNGLACGTFAETFTSKRSAEAWARAWKREMVAVEATAKERSEARAAYSWEVVDA